jgi:hypothetical protein
MAVVWADVLLIAPDLSSVPSGAQAVILADASTILSHAEYWPTPAMHDLAKKYLCAHLGALYVRAAGGGSASGSGAVASEAVGSVSVSYATPSTDLSDAGYATTFWGLQLQALARRSVMRVGLVA